MESLNTDTQLLTLAVHAGMLHHACEQALKLLQDPDASATDADRVEVLLIQALGANHA